MIYKGLHFRGVSPKNKSTSFEVLLFFVFVSVRTQHRLRVHSQHHLAEG